ncbi:hypothetical protein X962_5519 [Burkholderia pseudomallei MSHR7343]|nr:hypothetical protein X962_5519 [Burkholderia pseudomallei MSHR7343]
MVRCLTRLLRQCADVPMCICAYVRMCGCHDPPMH